MLVPMSHKRLTAIARCADEVDRCVRERGNPECPMATLGEVDWLCELHELLYEETNMDSRLLGIGGAPTRATSIPTEPAERKKYPVASGVLDYFPDAIAAVAHLSYTGNEQHNPGQPLHWARGKSTDEADTLMRHFLQRGTVDTDGIRHSTKMAWRALALLQKEIEAEQLTTVHSTGVSDATGYSPHFLPQSW